MFILSPLHLCHSSRFLIQPGTYGFEGDTWTWRGPEGLADQAASYPSPTKEFVHSWA